ncbi:hypothetical protein MTR_1g038885 [Medicago truncatula]|uniref:Uncharacterized protein n=1 Tax=Medicago truncatula TaxID=3880 RepID=A0A072VGP7_MEDTR|nr:hypothetical protein MTR_1g038885 [Medicago truncatula]
MWLLTGRLQPLAIRRWLVAAGGGPASRLAARGGSVGDKNLQSKVFRPSERNGGVNFAKNGRKVEFRWWQLFFFKNTLRKLKLSVDSFTQTQLRIWNLALMPIWLRNQERIHSLTLK